MILEIQHETRLKYSAPVTEWLAELRVEPVSDADQSCQTFFLGVSQPVQVQRYTDGFGNRVHHFNLLAPHPEVRLMAASVVETHPAPKSLTASRVRLPLDPDALPLEALDFVSFRGPVRRSERLGPLLARLAPEPGDRVSDAAAAAMTFVHENFKYAKAATNASSPIDDVLAKGMGVCQDFAHLMIGILRAAGIPARYVSGYVHRPNEESQSHAWCEVWVPDVGWVGLDPTNGKPVDDHFVKVAVGRDFTDVPPNKGVYRGAGGEAIFVRVGTRELERLPTLSWRDQLPPLDAPLTAVLTAAGRGPMTGDEEQQQQ
jgi:transglutaminase-like putative cysteine protease